MSSLFETNKTNHSMVKKDLTNIIEETEFYSGVEKNESKSVKKHYSHKLSLTNMNIHHFSNQNLSKYIPSLELLDSKVKDQHQITVIPSKELKVQKKSNIKSVNLDLTAVMHNSVSTPKSNKTTESPSRLTPSQIFPKFNLNPNNNYQVEKKLLLYQVKTSLLQAKKLCLSSEFQITGKKNKPTYYDIFSNYSNIKITKAEGYEKFDDENIKINNYLIYKSKLLGKGGYSSVYLCQDINTNKEYAVKVTAKNTRANKFKKKYDYVKEEVTILKRIHSQYVVQVYEIIETKKDIFIIMEYMKNNSLFNIIKNLTGFQVWRYFRNLICAVEHCHTIGKIVHRDINVNNLLISEIDTAKLSDFGISVIIEDDNDLLPCNSGPSTYTPPEKEYNTSEYYHGKPADMWLVGVTLFHMVFKKPLFTNFGNLTKEDYINIKFPDFENIDERIIELLEGLLNFDPLKRPTFQELQKNKWITHDDEFPLPDIHEEALEYCYKLTSEEILGMIDENNEII